MENMVESTEPSQEENVRSKTKKKVKGMFIVEDALS